jgi:hypothetical protein
MAQYDLKYFVEQFEGLPRKVAAIIALRAAVRVFPVLARRRDATDAALWFWPPEDRAHHTLAVCRSFQCSAFVNSCTEDASVAAASSSSSVAASSVSVAAASSSSVAAALASHAAAYVADSFTPSFAAAAAATGAAKTATAAEAYPVGISRALASHAAAISRDIAWIDRLPRRADAEGDPVSLLAQPLWLEDVPAEAAQLWIQLQEDLRSLDAGFQVWIDWYQDRLDGKSFDWEIERQWALLSKEQLSQSPAEINAYLKGLRGRSRQHP